MRVIGCKQRLLIYYNDTDIMAFVIEDGVIVKCTNADLVGKPEHEAHLTGSSVMRWWRADIQDNDYPSTIEFRPMISLPDPQT